MIQLCGCQGYHALAKFSNSCTEIWRAYQYWLTDLCTLYIFFFLFLPFLCFTTLSTLLSRALSCASSASSWFFLDANHSSTSTNFENGLLAALDMVSPNDRISPIFGCSGSARFWRFCIYELLLRHASLRDPMAITHLDVEWLALKEYFKVRVTVQHRMGNNLL